MVHQSSGVHHVDHERGFEICTGLDPSKLMYRGANSLAFVSAACSSMKDDENSVNRIPALSAKGRSPFSRGCTSMQINLCAVNLDYRGKDCAITTRNFGR